MSNNVVLALCQGLARRDIAALRFNFRGVGASSGQFGGGVAEQDDVRAALEMAVLTPGIDHQRIGLTGYSFGGGVALTVALTETSVGGLALVSPAVAPADWPKLKQYAKPKLIIIGDGDRVLPFDEYRPQIEENLTPEQYRIVTGVDHFWWGCETMAVDEVARFLDNNLALG